MKGIRSAIGAPLRAALVPVCVIAALCIHVIAGVAVANDRRASDVVPLSPTRHETLPPEIAAFAGHPRASLSDAAADTFHLAWFTFDNNGADQQGWTTHDLTTQTTTYFHVASGTELDGGQFGGLLPLEGNQSAWCGQYTSGDVPYCGWVTLPGYGNNWRQKLESKTVYCDSLRLYYKVRWDMEQGYDNVTVESIRFSEPYVSWWEQASYTGKGDATECITIQVPYDSTRIRFLVQSDHIFSDEDGLYQSDGAVLLDSIFVECYANGILTDSFYEDFEDEAHGATTTNDGFWTAEPLAGFGDFAALYPGITLVQEDPCRTIFNYVWGFFDDFTISNYACGGYPTQGAVRPSGGNPCTAISNEIWSPPIPFVGSGSEVVLSMDVYPDLGFSAFIFYVWKVRSWIGGCPGPWKSNNLPYSPAQKAWFDHHQSIGAYVEPGADSIQVALGVVDLCPIYCPFGCGDIERDCVSHGPLFDNVHVTRIATVGPRISVLHANLFQDNFAEDGTTTGSARADMANDTNPSVNPAVRPGDSIVVSVNDPDVGLKDDPYTSLGPAVYMYVSVWPQNQPGKSGPDLQSPEYATNGDRFPLVDSLMHDGATWYCFRGDSIREAGWLVNPQRLGQYCFDLRDDVFTPGDTICYILTATSADDNKSYFSRRLGGQAEDFVTNNLAEALDSPMEFTILPAGGWLRGGDVLFVDDADDRSGPPQVFFDYAINMTTQKGFVDRYDVLASSSFAGNTLASRVKDVTAQVTNCYRTILWCSADIETNTLGEGFPTGLEKGDDYALLLQFLDTHPNNPGLYLTGDNMAEEWASLTTASSTSLRSQYVNFDLVGGDHIALGLPISPLLTATGSCFTHGGVPDELVAHGGCPIINNFDVLQATGLSQAEFKYLDDNLTFVLSQATANSAASVARVILSGFSFHEVENAAVGTPTRTEHLVDILIWLQTLTTIVGAPDTPVPLVNGLDYAYPNPFNPTTTIHYDIRSQGPVSLRVYDVTGALVRTLVNEVQTPRPDGFTIEWNGRNDSGGEVASGVYFYRIVTKGFDETRKMVLLK